MSVFSGLDTKTEQVIANAVNTFAVPTDNTFGASIRVTERDPVQHNTAGAWLRGGEGGARMDAVLHFDASADGVTIAAGLALFGFRTDLGKWFMLGQLNGGAAIPVLKQNCGWATVVENAGAYDRLAIGPLTTAAVAVAGGTVTVRATQLRVTEDLWA